MKLRNLLFILAAAVIIVAAVYGIDKKINPYRGLVTHIDVQFDEETIAMLESQIEVWQASVDASLAVEEDPNLDLLEQIAINYLYLGDLVSARETYDEYFEYNAINPVAWNNYGNILKRMEDYKGAETAYRKSLDIDSGLEEYYRDLIDLYEDIWPGEKSDEIKQLLENSVDNIGQTQWNMGRLAEWYLDQGDCQRAIDHYQVQLTLVKNETTAQDIIDQIEDSIEIAKHACDE